jgi:acyl dehydratase
VNARGIACRWASAEPALRDPARCAPAPRSERRNCYWEGGSAILDSASVVTDELRAVVGIESEPYENEIDRGAIRKYVEAIEDPNPIYVDDAYARRSPHGTIIAPPTFPCTLRTGHPRVPIPLPPGYTELLNGGAEYLYERPIRLHEVLTGTSRLTDVFEKDGRLGHMLFLVTEKAFRDRDDAVVARMVGTIIRYAPPDPAAPRPSRPAPLVDDRTAGETAGPGGPAAGETACVDAGLESLGEAGAIPGPRYFEDVVDGETLPSLAKRPTQRHLVMYAGASGNYDPIHYDREHALRLGLPGIILHGNLKIAYLGQVLTDWITPYGTVLKLAAQVRGMDLFGNVCLAKGTVTRKTAENGSDLVELDLWSEEPGGKRTTIGSAIARLPGRSR